MGEITGEDGGAGAEPVAVAAPALAAVPVGQGHVGRRPAPPPIRAVHDVVVDQGEGVQHLDGGGDVGDALGRLVARGRPPPVHEGRAQPLPPGAEQVLHGTDQLVEHRVDPPELHALRRQEVAEDPVEAVPDRCQRVLPGPGVDGGEGAGGEVEQLVVVEPPAERQRSGRWPSWPSSTTWVTAHGLSDAGSASARRRNASHRTQRTSSTSSGSGSGSPSTTAKTTGQSSCSTVPSAISAR